jgi:alcohol dehydrogenase (cytochrome c)
MQIDQPNVEHLTLAWTVRVTAGLEASGGRRGFGNAVPTIVSGEGAEPSAGGFGGTANIRASILAVDGVLYFSKPDNAWAADARDGHLLWHYFWKTKGGTHIGNRGLGKWGNWLYMETPDDYLICLEAKTGKERWHKEIANFNQQYFSTMAPVVVGNHILIGTGNDLDEPGYVQARDPETGDIQWTYDTVPTKKGDPGLDTWAALMARTMGRATSGFPALMIRKRTSIFSVLAILPRLTPILPAAMAIISTPARSSPLTWIPERWPGITS